ncbi:MAG TPA: cupredoxin domain-containing protein [Thermoanaerobaculia bacterium]|nr:cupredoxin domain-containing protein [Thermoanaerobaculia bacterium]
MRKLLLLLGLAAACAQPREYSGPDITMGGKARDRVIVMTEALVTKEGGPKEALAAFGEAYAFDPATIAVRQERPTEIVFWNLQADDDHDFMLLDSHGEVVFRTKLLPLQKPSFVFTFHRPGLYRFYCTMHQPEMSGAFVVTPQPQRR